MDIPAVMNDVELRVLGALLDSWEPLTRGQVATLTGLSEALCCLLLGRLCNRGLATLDFDKRCRYSAACVFFPA